MAGRQLIFGAAILVLATGCGATADSTDEASRPTHSAAQHHMGQHESMRGMDMSSSSQEPTEAATMICSDEISEAAVATLSLDAAPHSVDNWSNLLYTCTYHTPQGALVLSVKDSPDEKSGMAYFRQLRGQLDRETGVHPIAGLASLGLPSYESDNGNVVFIKDGKTLHVDATGIDAAATKGTASSTELAYQIATDVIACWSE